MSAAFTLSAPGVPLTKGAVLNPGTPVGVAGLPGGGADGVSSAPGRDVFAEALAAAMTVGASPAPVQAAVATTEGGEPVTAPEAARARLQLSLAPTALTPAAVAPLPAAEAAGDAAQPSSPNLVPSTGGPSIAAQPVANAAAQPFGESRPTTVEPTTIHALAGLPESGPPVVAQAVAGAPAQPPEPLQGGEAAPTTMDGPREAQGDVQNRMREPGPIAPAAPPPPQAGSLTQALAGLDKPAAVSGARVSDREAAPTPNGAVPTGEPGEAVVQPSLAAAAGGAPEDGFGGNGDARPDFETMAREADGPDAVSGETVFEPTFTAADPAIDADAPAPASRATPETVAALAAEVARKLDARVSRFELTLNPEGLGAVQVSVEIRDGGDVTAHLQFERAETAAELKARSAELRSALEGAGFSVGASGLDFGGAGGGRGRAPEPEFRSARASVFLNANEPAAPAIVARPSDRRGLDLRV